ncbi:uncharacterized protein LOC113310730 [Papaver somniferum]|uniref:uncharacterized protein LOC113310730 n=1 Tax=Papaver somniferum TaxID=3469 RepID=UPI000E6F8B69|nr:uncharacterized protein LOC113310730 [Papaver somniferum]XP_026415288.1 uncharacterized protein LOC113310730 [Papaver somniferum]
MVILFQTTDFLRHAPTTSARPLFGITGRVCLKSAPITTVIPPKVLPPTKSNEAIPNDATVSTASPLNRQLAAIVLYRNVFPVPALPFRKKENVLASFRIRAVVCPTGGLWIPITAWTVHHTLSYCIKEEWIFLLIWKFCRNKFVHLLNCTMTDTSSAVGRLYRLLSEFSLKYRETCTGF